MTLSEANRIDIVSEDPNGEIALSIVAPEPWDDGERRLQELTDKLCAYLYYMQSEEYRARFGAKAASIRLITAEEPPEPVRQLLDATAEAASLRIEVERLPSIGLEPRLTDSAETGKRLEEKLKVASPVSPSSRQVSSKRSVQAVFGALGVLAGVGAAIYSYSLSSSFALAIFVFLVTNYVVARGVADVITDPYKIRRIFYFALLPALSTVILYLSYLEWDRMWLAVTLGLVGGLILNGIIAPRAFPLVHHEEEEDSLERMKATIGRHAGA